MNYIITNNKSFFERIGKYNYCTLEEMVLPKTIAFDTETTSLKPILGEVFSIQIGTGKDNYLIDLQKLGNELTFEQVVPFLKDKTLVGHNLTFDLGWCYKYNFYPEKVYDTFIASKILYNGDKNVYLHNFGEVMQRELGITYDKSEQKNIHKTQLSNTRAIEYAFNDVDRLLDLLKVMGGKIRENNQLETFELHCRYIKALAYMETCGLPFDEGYWLKKIEEDKVVFKGNQQKIVEYIWENLPKYRDNQIDMFSNEKKIHVNIKSTKQVLPVFKDLGINVKSDKDPNKETIQEDIIKKSSHEFVEIWLDYKGAEHDLTTYGENILEKVIDGRIYTSFNPILDTARISTRKGDVNVLNLPSNKRTRECVRAKKGYKIIVADYEGQENSVLAGKSNDEAMVDAVLNGADLHCAFARYIFPELEFLSDEEIVRDHPEKRKFSKAPRFSLSYGGNGYTVAKNLNIPEDEGKRIEELYKKLHKGVYKWGEGVFEEAISNGFIDSCLGFRLYLPYYDDFIELHEWIENKDQEFWALYRVGKAENEKLKEDEDYKITNTFAHNFYLNNKSKISKYFKNKSKYFRLCLNNPIQTTAAHQTKLAAVMLFEEIVKNKHQGLVKICNIPHDEFVLEVKEELVSQYKSVLEKCMKVGGDKVLGSPIIKMKAEANVGRDWYEAK